MKRQPTTKKIGHEFYLNAFVNRNYDIVVVRGKLVSFSMEMINAYFGLEAPDVDKFQCYNINGPPRDHKVNMCTEQ